MSTTASGVVLGLGALGAAARALLAPGLARRFGPPMMLVALAITPLTQIPLLLASPGLRWEIVTGVALIVQLACAGAAGTTQRSIRQIITASHMQTGCTVSTWLTAGARPVGALLAGGPGTWAGVRAALVIGVCLASRRSCSWPSPRCAACRRCPTPRPDRMTQPPPSRGQPPQVPAPDTHRENSSDGGAT